MNQGDDPLKNRGTMIVPQTDHLRVLSTLPGLSGAQKSEQMLLAYQNFCAIIYSVQYHLVFFQCLDWFASGSAIRRLPQAEFRLKRPAVAYRESQPEANSGRTKGNRGTREQWSGSACPTRIAPEGKPGLVQTAAIGTFFIPVGKSRFRPRILVS